MASATGGRCGPRVPGRRRPPLSLLFLLASAFLASCVFVLSECRAAGRPDARHLCGDGGRRIGKEVEEGRDRWALGLGFRESSRRGRGKLTRLGLPRSGRIPSRRFHQRLSFSPPPTSRAGSGGLRSSGRVWLGIRKLS